MLAPTDRNRTVPQNEPSAIGRGISPRKPEEAFGLDIDRPPEEMQTPHEDLSRRARECPLLEQFVSYIATQVVRS